MITQEVNIEQGPVRLEEIKEAIKKLNYKCGGPDDTCTEMFKALNDEALESIEKALNVWGTREEIEEKTQRAREVHIYKKGCTSNLSNYRPISLLSMIYKLILKCRGVSNWDLDWAGGVGCCCARQGGIGGCLHQ